MTQKKNYSINAILLCSISYFKISIFDPVSQLAGSYHLLSYKD